jgi:hypothetical protein
VKSAEVIGRGKRKDIIEESNQKTIPSSLNRELRSKYSVESDFF